MFGKSAQGANHCIPLTTLKIIISTCKHPKTLCILTWTMNRTIIVNIFFITKIEKLIHIWKVEQMRRSFINHTRHNIFGCFQVEKIRGGNLKKKTRKQELEQESDQEKKKVFSFFLGRVLVFFLVFLIAFLVEFLFSCFLYLFFINPLL